MKLLPQDIRAIFDRRVAVRVYNNQKISRTDMETILDSAWLSPSSIGLEGWRFLVFENGRAGSPFEAIKADLKAVAWGPCLNWTRQVTLCSYLQIRMPDTIALLFTRA